jgi:hypothetical protein
VPQPARQSILIVLSDVTQLSIRCATRYSQTEKIRFILKFLSGHHFMSLVQSTTDRIHVFGYNMAIDGSRCAMTHEQIGLLCIDEIDIEITRLLRINANYTIIHGLFAYIFHYLRKYG